MVTTEESSGDGEGINVFEAILLADDKQLRDFVRLLASEPDEFSEDGGRGSPETPPRVIVAGYDEVDLPSLESGVLTKSASKDKYNPPESARNNARKVLRWRDEHGDAVRGMTAVGWTRANQLASGEGLTRETVGRMAAFARHRKNGKVDPQYKDEPWRDAGYVAWLGWGGDSGVNWASEIVAGETKSLFGLRQIAKAGYSPLQPRGDDGRWIRIAEIAEAAVDASKAEELRQKVTNPREREKLDEAIADANKGLVQTDSLSDFDRSAYEQAIDIFETNLAKSHIPKRLKGIFLDQFVRTIENIPPNAMHRFSAVKEIVFGMNNADLRRQLNDAGDVPPEEIGGAFQPETMTLYLKSATYPRGGLGVYAHEIAHVVDMNSGGIRFSTSQEWVVIWENEVRDGLTNYANTDSTEGFAEFARVAWSKRDPAHKQYVKNRWPLSSAFFEKRGFL